VDVQRVFEGLQEQRRLYGAPKVVQNAQSETTGFCNDVIVVIVVIFVVFVVVEDGGCEDEEGADVLYFSSARRR
jgi:hypothetical protein